MPPSRTAPLSILLTLAVALWLTACAPAPEAGAASAPPAADTTAAPTVLPSATFTAPPTRTSPPPTVTPTETSEPAPTFTPTSSPSPSPTACPHPLGQLEYTQIGSVVLNRPLSFRVFLPPCYDPQRAGGYPVLYLLHGQSMDDSGWDLISADETAGRLIAAGETAPFLIVMPREDYYLQDMTVSGYGRALLEDLLPWIETTYNTCNQRSCRAIGGLSRGATWAMMVGLEHPNLFASAGGHSLPNAIYSPYYLKTLWESMPEGERIRLYLDIGEWDRYKPGAEEFHQRLEFLGIPHEWQLNSGTHDYDYWIANVEDYLRWYAADW